MNDESLEVLCGRLYDAKQAEAAAKEARIALENQIAAQIETGENGSKTVPVCEGLKVTVKRGINYKADIASIRELDGLSLLPLSLKPAKWEFDAKAYEQMRKDRPDDAAKVAEFVTATPAKVAVSLKI